MMGRITNKAYIIQYIIVLFVVFIFTWFFSEFYPPHAKTRTCEWRHSTSGSNYPITSWTQASVFQSQVWHRRPSAFCRSITADREIMSVAPGRMMMAWVWISLVILARLNTADDPHRGTDGRLTGLEALFSDAEPPGETRSLVRFFPVPLWKFLKGKIKPHLVPVSRVVINVKIVIFFNC